MAGHITAQIESAFAWETAEDWDAACLLRTTNMSAGSECSLSAIA
jgi:hypothetical protein